MLTFQIFIFLDLKNPFDVDPGNPLRSKLVKKKKKKKEEIAEVQMVINIDSTFIQRII